MRRALLGAAVVLFLWGVAVALTGGIDARFAGIAIRSRDPFRAQALSLALFVAVSIRYRTELTQSIARIVARVSRAAGPLALAGGLALAAHGVVFGSFSVGGADSYGYVDQAYEWRNGTLPAPLPLPLTLPFATSEPMQTPLGYRVGVRPGTMVPVYAPGLPLIMAVALLAGSCGPFLVVPFFSAVFVWFTFRLGRLAAGPTAGVIAVISLLASPVVLYQALWPMSDIPAGALWTGALVHALGPRRRDALVAGLLTAVGLLVRPNLLFVAAVPLLMVAMSADGRERWKRVVLFGAPIVPVVLGVAWLNTQWYGSPAISGYGATSELYLAANVWPNVKLYASWLWQSQSAWLLLAVVPLLPPFASHPSRRVMAACVLMIGATFASYVSYLQFDVWWYLRFLMPAFGAFAVLLACGAVAIARTVPQPFGRIAAATAVYLMVAATLSFASEKGAFGRLREGERRYVGIGEFAADHLPANAALFAMQHSGSLRFYSGRMTLRFDWVQKEWASQVPAAIERAGYHPYLVADDWEIPQVRRQFGLPENGSLPWPIVAQTRALGGLTVFDMATAPAAAPPIALQPGSRELCAPRRAPAI